MSRTLRGRRFGPLPAMQRHVAALALYETAVPDRNGFKLKRRDSFHGDLLALNLVKPRAAGQSAQSISFVMVRADDVLAGGAILVTDGRNFAVAQALPNYGAI